VSIILCTVNACGQTSTVKSNVSEDGFSPGWPHINCRQIERLLGPGFQVPGSRLRSRPRHRPRLHINCRSADRQGPWTTDHGAGAICCLLPLLGFYFHLCFLSASLKSRTATGAVGRADLCQRHHRGTHRQQQKVSFGYMSKKQRKKATWYGKKQKTSTVKINKKN